MNPTQKAPSLPVGTILLPADTKTYGNSTARVDRDGRVLIGFSKFIDKLLGLFDSVLVIRRT
jgi:hypothetical protein